MKFEEAWRDAERTVFEMLCKHFGSAENKDAFRGMLPAVDQAWALMTGGGASERNQDRFAANGQGYASMAMTASLEYASVDRDAALVWAMKAMDFFRRQGNCRNVHNVNWFHAIDVPGEPLWVKVNDDIAMWRLSIKCQLIYRTDTVLS